MGPSASPSQLRARPARQRSACFGLVEADDEEAAHSAAEQRYLKVGAAQSATFILPAQLTLSIQDLSFCETSERSASKQGYSKAITQALAKASLAHLPIT